ncbi:hypothetical protein BU23DRAFT_532398 [Bimuria novae-zelandiae CBS 107.79]|uniref:Uncharacterized protein n=1 Tax=Bimuria novae-zelandiae CBS 107.79 TaxID=1447943 RepID=A0A6A5VA27_9PLEO|nr:hypothetical protein BU23DRAFT_532398 [Bimuria novae-zelandiae CBS 107.79]
MEPVAVIGLALRFSGDAVSEKSFWDVMMEKRCTKTEWPQNRVNIEAFYDDRNPSKSAISSRGANLLSEDPTLFDAPFFSISNNEASALDPQQCLLLETAYQAIENAGLTLDSIRGSSTGVYTGCMNDDYKTILARDIDLTPKYSALGVSQSMLANRISWMFDLKGPSLNVDTACSSSLMAVDIACQAIRGGDTSMALVGGVNLLLGVESSIGMSKMGILSPDAQCHSFDERANGFARGEGIGVVMLKRLSDAVRDNDTIRAVIRSTASNSDGRTPGITQPSSERQEELIRYAYEKANLDFSLTRYFEAHGTGTPIGDPIEAHAIASVFSKHRTPDNPLYVGAMKANFGHTEGASGIAALIKTVMVLEKGIIPPIAHLEKLNAKLRPDLWNLEFVKEARAWPKAAIRRASVNSFGFGGSNTHVVVDDAVGYLISQGIEAHHSRVSKDSAEINGFHETKQDIDSVKETNGFHELNDVNETNGTYELAKTQPAGIKNSNGVNGTDDNSKTNGIGQINGQPTKSDEGTNGEQGLNGRPEPIQAKAINGIHEVNGVNGVHKPNGIHNGAEDDRTTNGVHLTNGAHTNGIKKPSRTPYLLTWSASDETALERMNTEFSKHLKTGVNEQYLQELAYTLSCRRTTFGWRSFAVLDSVDDAVDLDKHLSDRIRSAREAAAIFAFTGQGAQYKQMGLELLQYPAFKDSLEKFDDCLLRLGCEWSLFEVLQADDTRIHKPEHSQPLCTALQVALVDLLRTFDSVPAAVLGHSSGEIAAAYAAGGIDLDSACKISFFRGKFAAEVAKSGANGSMLAVGLSETDVLPYLKSTEISVACVNSPVNVTLSGSKPAIQALHARLEDTGIFSRELSTGVAYHSQVMKSVATDYAAAIEGITQPSGVPDMVRIASTVTGELVKDINCFSDPQYWVRNLVSPVRFSDALLQLTARPKGARKLGQKAQIVCTDVVEIGPHSALKRPIEETLSHNKRQLRYWTALSRNEAAATHLLRLVGQVFCLGYKVDLARANHLDPKKRLRTLTDLPQYSFSHTRSYWRETTLSSGIAKRRHFPRPLLGAPVADWNPLEPKWRQYLSVQTHPWVVDHQVDNAILFPGAAMIVLALEAAHQMSEADAPITGYRIKEATFSSPIVIPSAEEDQAEIETSYRPIWMPSANGSSFSEVRISVRNGESVQEACRVVLKVEVDHPRSGLDDGSEMAAYKKYLQDRYHELASPCEKAIDAKAVYRTYNKMGLQYGPMFRGIHQPAWNGLDSCKANILMGHNEGFEVDPNEFPIHPATLDILAHLMWVPLTNGGVQTVPTALPTRIRDAWVSNVGLRDNRVHAMHGVARSWKRDFKVVEGTAVMLNDADEPIFALGTLEFSTITRHGPDSSQSRFLPLFFSMRTMPDISLMDKAQFQQFIEPVATHDAAESAFDLDLQSALQWFISTTLDQLKGEDLGTLQPHMQKYVDWMQLQAKQFPEQSGEMMNKEASREALFNRIEDANDRGKVYMTFGRQLYSIVRGTTDPLELLFTNPLAETFYADLMRSVSVDAKIRKFLEAFSFKNPSLKILEVGAGTGSMTSYVLAPLLSNGSPLFSRYDFTDVSTGFFEKANEKLALTAPVERFDFRIFDLEADPLAQGLEASSYDLIVAASVIHATSNLTATLARLRTVLKPGGKLILFEVLRPECIRVASVFGTLPGWWASTDFRADGDRRWGPNITTDQWKSLLSGTGFSVDAVVRDHEDEFCHEFGFIFATAVEEEESTMSVEDTMLVVNPASNASEKLAAALDASQGIGKMKTISLDDIRSPQDLTGQRIIVLAEMDTPLLRNISEAHYEAINLIASCGRPVLWVHQTGQGTDQFSDYQMINGLVRVLRSENPNRAFVTLALQDPAADDSNAEKIKKILHELEDGRWSIEQCEQEYVERDNTLQLQRVFDEDEMDNKIFSRTTQQLREERWDSAGPLALTVHSPGLLDSLCFVADPLAENVAALAPEEVLVDVRAIGVNFRDILTALGAMDTDRLGVECTGIVREAGSKSSLQPGDRVIIPKIGCARSTVRCNSQVVVEIPECMSFEEAASFPTIAVTAYYSLVDVARIEKGETILVHAGAGGTGQFCIQLAQLAGAEVYATTSSQAKKDFLMSRYGIPADHIFYSRNTSFAEAVRQATNGRGVDVLVNSLAGDSLIASWELMAPHGRFLELGRADINGNSNLPMMNFKNNVSFSSIALDYILDHRPVQLARMLNAVTDMLTRGDLKLPSPLRTYSVSEITDAFRHLQSGGSVGKIVLTVDPSDVVKTYRIESSHWTFPENATYVIAGGLGGLGRSAARWMVARGAKHLILLSRSGPVAKASQELLADLRKAGATVEAPRCDVSLEDSLRSVLQELEAKMPPIKGCLQGTMVLRDALFEKMSYADWVAATESKTTASWNLHKLLPKGMDFFLFLSSLCGIVGNLGQANYAAGNTYQDALAYHRVSQGEKGTSLDIGAMASVGIIAENTEYMGLMGHDEDVIRVVQENEFHAVLDIYLGPDPPATGSEMAAQALVGMSTPQVYIDNGIELPTLLNQRMYAPLARLGAHSSDATARADNANGINYAKAFRAATSADEASSVVLAALTSKLSRALSVAPEDLDPSKPLHQYGVDSLVAVELRNWFGKEFESIVTVLKIMSAVDVRAVATLVVEQSTVKKQYE